MTSSDSQVSQAARVSRRTVFTQSTAGVLSVAGLSVLAGPAAAGFFGKDGKKAAEDPKADADLLNVALALEHEGIAAYQIGAESGLLTPGVLKIGVQFQGHHKTHRDDLVAAIRTLGGAPAEAETMAHYAEAIDAASLKNELDILKLAIRLEEGATNAYVGVIPSFVKRENAYLFARIAADEAMHWAALKTAIGEPLPDQAPVFG